MTVQTVESLVVFEVREKDGSLLLVSSSRDEAESQAVFSEGDTITERLWAQVPRGVDLEQLKRDLRAGGA